ncbi:hypothetical protein ACOMICROBIO_EPCKBFOG_04331 [Vibrio sp. B1FLJ16]|nr:hypothetical protein ACOMICROBIO_EPCKBFOG_04331 [Vibrio sp. B1FLJ16]CAE6950947.1 hypothetical protein ACOMICROBIO_EPCKBFOG_04331 [Vibrio sp. B1FLJ16]
MKKHGLFTAECRQTGDSGKYLAIKPRNDEVTSFIVITSSSHDHASGNFTDKREIHVTQCNQTIFYTLGEIVIKTPF